MKKILQITWKVTPTAKGRRLQCRTLYHRRSIPINGSPIETLTEVFGKPVSHTPGPKGSTTTIFESGKGPKINLTKDVRRHPEEIWERLHSEEEAWEGLPA